MKKCLYSGILVLFLWSCQTPNPQEELADLIRRYENFEAYDPKEFPLGDFSEERFEKEAVFSEQLIDQLQALPKEELDEDDRISHALLLFELNEKQAAFEYKTHWNPILSDNIANFITASFDIECDSSHGDFPNPQKDFKKLQ